MDRRAAFLSAAAAAARRPQADAAAPLLVVGVHREEFGFGREVAAALDAGEVDVLEIPQGLSGRRPLPDQAFRYRALHEALYRQLVPHMRGKHGLLIDLHTGCDESGPSADLITADAALRARLQAALAAPASADTASAGEAAGAAVRVVELGADGCGPARTVIPEEVWNNPAFAYVGIELYLPGDAALRPQALALARRLVRLVAGCFAGRA